MKKILFVLFAFLFIVPSFVRAQADEQIQTYDVHITIEQPGSIQVTERIVYEFDAPRHGIIRSIPVIKPNADGKKYEMTISDVHVLDEVGASYTFTREDGDSVELKIGDADKTIIGTHTYVISYTVLGALTYFPSHDELYWNAVGDEWSVPIERVTTTVSFPSSAPPADLHAECFTGSAGSNAEDCAISYVDDSVKVAVFNPLDVYEGATIVVGFPKGMVAVLNPTEVVPFFSTLIGKITLIAIGIVALLWYLILPFLIIYKWWKTGRDPKPAMGEVSAWFSPPKTKSLRELTPAETGTLVDETADARDIYATLVDLARRGYVQIIEVKKKGLLASGVDFELEKKKSWDEADIQTFEKDLLDGIFATKDRVSIKDLDLTSTFEKVKKGVYTRLVTDGFFPENPASIRTGYYVLSGFAFMSGNLFLFLVALLFGKNMPKKTLYGAEQAAMGRSLKNFLESQDKHLAFQAKKQMMFEKLLPYAVAFGVEIIWAERFKSLGLKQPDWYTSSSGSRFNSVVFATSLGRSASMSFAASVTVKSSTGHSSGFSGGFSGGGGGGGGGGSW